MAQIASAIHDGELLHFAPRDGIYVYFRSNATQRVMVVMNNEKNLVHLDSARYSQGLGDSSTARNVLVGRGIVSRIAFLSPPSLRKCLSSTKAWRRLPEQR